MSKKRIAWRSALSLACLMVAATVASASANQTFVASTGSDSNTSVNCNRASPCRNIAAALTVTNSGGIITALDEGPFDVGTTLAITKSVKILGVDGPRSIVNANLTIGLACGTSVELRSLLVDGQGQGSTGINVSGVGRLFIDDSIVENYSGDGIDFDVTSSCSSPPTALFVENSIVRRNGGDGIEISSGSGEVIASITKNTKLQDNGDSGLQLLDNATVTFHNSEATYNANAGLEVAPSSGTSALDVTESKIDLNTTGLLLGPGSSATAIICMANSFVVENNTRGSKTGAGSSNFGEPQQVSNSNVFSRSGSAGNIGFPTLHPTFCNN